METDLRRCGGRGQRFYDWTRIAIRPQGQDGFGHWVLARRRISDPTKIAYYVCYGPGSLAAAGPVRSVTDGQATLAVAGPCRPADNELHAALSAVHAGRWADLTAFPGSYWVTADDGRARFACGDLAGLRPVYYTPTGEWATDVQCLGYRLVPDLALLAARIVAGDHWPERSVYEGIGLVPGGYGLLLEPGQAPRLVDIKAIDPVPDLATGARRFGATLTQAVQERVRAAGTAVGADLSGGLDSSSAAILAAEVGDVHAVTYADRYTSTEDETLAARLAEHAGLLHTVTFGGDGELPFSFPPGQPTGDEPTLDAAVYAMDRAYLKPVAGLPLHLTGHGGDVVLDAIHLGQPHHLGDAAIHQAAEAAGADSVIAALPGGLDTSLARSWWGGHDLSGGQWQRLAIARAFHRDAPVLVLDEPTAALDARAEHRVFTRLKALSRGRATIFITHRLANARIADRIIVLDGGRVAETGTYTELMARGNASLFHQMLRLQEDA